MTSLMSTFDYRATIVEDERVQELARNQEGYASVVVSRDGDGLVFWSDFDDNGKSIVSQSRMPVADYLAKGERPWPWYELRERRRAALQVFSALGIAPQPWTEPLSTELFDMFEHARNEWGSTAGGAVVISALDG